MNSEQNSSKSMKKLRNEKYGGIPLSEKECQLMDLVCDGMDQREIADTLFISIDAVKSRVKHIYAKLNASRATEAVAIYTRQRVLRQPGIGEATIGVQRAVYRRAFNLMHELIKAACPAQGLHNFASETRNTVHGHRKYCKFCGYDTRGDLIAKADR